MGEHFPPNRRLRSWRPKLSEAAVAECLTWRFLAAGEIGCGSRVAFALSRVEEISDSQKQALCVVQHFQRRLRRRWQPHVLDG